MNCRRVAWISDGAEIGNISDENINRFNDYDNYDRGQSRSVGQFNGGFSAVNPADNDREIVD